MIFYSDEVLTMTDVGNFNLGVTILFLIQVEAYSIDRNLGATLYYFYNATYGNNLDKRLEVL